jgi:hypothetical protein
MFLFIIKVLVITLIVSALKFALYGDLEKAKKEVPKTFFLCLILLAFISLIKSLILAIIVFVVLGVSVEFVLGKIAKKSSDNE